MKKHEDEIAFAYQELAPTGILRMGVVEALSPGLIFVVRGKVGSGPLGVVADIGRYVAQAAGIPISFRFFSNSGLCAGAVSDGSIDLAFFPEDAMRRTMVAFGAPYYALESTFLIAGHPSVRTVADVDMPGMRVLAISDTTTLRAATRSLHQTRPQAVNSVHVAVTLMQQGKADALALSRDSLFELMPLIAGSRLAEGNFQRTNVSAALPPGRPGALSVVNAIVERAKQEGVVRRYFDQYGFSNEAVAP